MRAIWTRRGTWIAAALMMTWTASISNAGDKELFKRAGAEDISYTGETKAA